MVRLTETGRTAASAGSFQSRREHSKRLLADGFHLATIDRPENHGHNISAEGSPDRPLSNLPDVPRRLVLGNPRRTAGAELDSRLSQLGDELSNEQNWVTVTCRSHGSSPAPFSHQLGTSETGRPPLTRPVRRPISHSNERRLSRFPSDNERVSWRFTERFIRNRRETSVREPSVHPVEFVGATPDE